MRTGTLSSIESRWLPVLFLMAGLALADDQVEDGGLDDLLSGFETEDSGFDDVVIEQPVEPDKTWRFSADINLISTYGYARSEPAPGNTDYGKWAQLRIKVRPEFWFQISDDWDAKISGSAFYDFAYKVVGKEAFANPILNDSENEAEFRDTYLQGKLASNLDIKLGRQIVVWGKSDNLRVVDVINPLDNREPGQVDIEDLRLPLNMARFDYYVDKWNLSALAIYEVRFDKNPVWGSDYYPATTPLPPEHVPGDGGSNSEYALALNGRMQGWDISFHLARLWDDRAHLSTENYQPILLHSRLNMAGVAANIVAGNWLYKAELAALDGLEFSVLPKEEFSRFDLMLGVEYSGFDNTTLSLESLVRHVNDWQKQLVTDPLPAQENLYQTAFRYNADFFHSRLNTVLLVMRFGSDLDDGGFTRLQFKYELRDALSLTLGSVVYHGGNQVPFEMISDNDRLFLDLKYSF